MGACHPTRLLRREHELILRMVGVLEKILDGAPDAAALADLGQCITFFRLFTDACHHGKEEDLLFEALVEQGLPRHDGPIGVMLDEHRRGRTLVAEIAGHLDRVRAGEPAWDHLVAAGRAYVDLLREHILKEDHALFEMADTAISESRCRRLCEGYEAADARRFEGRTLEDLEQAARRLADRYRC
jgi:hemerythrin-like domain-containing protein